MGPKTRTNLPHSTVEVMDLISHTDDDEDVMIINFIPKNTHHLVCEICTDTKTMKDIFYISGCSHAYCSDCIAKYIHSKLQDNIINIRCPSVSGCSGWLEPEFCRSILRVELFDRWCNKLCEALFDSQKFYCPFGDCSALLINHGSEAAIRNSECPHCNRMFCAQCKIPWHEGIECTAAERGKEEEVRLMCLAEKLKWKRCPNCKFYVCKSNGCGRITCRCGCKFCYRCGDAYNDYGRCNCERLRGNRLRRTRFCRINVLRQKI